MKTFFKQLGKAICYFLLYYGMQLILCFVYMLVYIVRTVAETAGKVAAATDLGLEVSEWIPDAETIAFGAIDYLLQKQNDLIIISGILTIAFLVLFFLIRKKNVLTETGVVKTKGKYLALGLGLGLTTMLMINFGLSLLPESWLEDYAAQSSVLLGGSDLAIFVSTVIMAPLIEELICRGLMLSRLRKGMPDWAAVLVSSLIFGLAHGQIVWITYAFLLGVVFGVVAVKSESILPGLVMHMVFNLCGMVLPFLLSESISLGICAVLTVIGALLTAALLAVLLKQKKEN